MDNHHHPHSPTSSTPIAMMPSRSRPDEEVLSSYLILQPTLITLADEHMSADDLTSGINKAIYLSVREINANHPEAAANPESQTYESLIISAIDKRGIPTSEFLTFVGELYGNIFPRKACDFEIVACAKSIHQSALVRIDDEKLDAIDKRLDTVLRAYRNRDKPLSEVAEAFREEAERILTNRNEVGVRDAFQSYHADEIPASERIEWLIPDYLPRGGLVQLAGAPKCGKSTLARYLVQAGCKGGSILGRSVQPFRTLIITEESLSIWRRYAQELRLGSEVEICSRPFIGKPRADEFRTLIQWIIKRVKSDGFTLIVIDTLSAFLPTDNENDSAMMEAALAPLRSVSQTGAAVLAIHHTRKSCGEYGVGIRGSSAITGFFDTNLELKRVVGSVNQRTIAATSRYSETPDELVLELGGHGYRAIGSTGQARRLSEITAITQIITEANRPGGLTWKEILELWPDDADSPPKPSRSKLNNLLKNNSNGDLPIWIRNRQGGSNTPYRYDTYAPKYQPDSEPSKSLKGGYLDVHRNQTLCPSTTTYLSGWTQKRDFSGDMSVDESTQQNDRLDANKPCENDPDNDKPDDNPNESWSAVVSTFDDDSHDDWYSTLTGCPFY